MRITSVAAGLLAAAAIQAFAQGPVPTGPQPVSAQPPAGTAATPVVPLELTNAADGRKVTVRRGDEIKLVLDLNGIYELAWEMQAPAAPTLAQIGERIFLTKSGIYLGTGGWNVFRYRAEQPGTVTLLFAYGPFDDAAPATKSVRYHVTVE